MAGKDLYADVLGALKEKMGKVGSELMFASPFQLIIAVVLSAQCTDKRVNMVTPELFRRYPDAQTLSKADFDEVFSLVSSVSYPNSKARHIIALSKMLAGDFGGEVPSEPEQLVKLPGVGRKTANVVASIIYGKPVIAVDTHVFRVSRRIGLSDGTNVEQVERDLTQNIPPEERADAHHYLLLHGRYVCRAKNPLCGECAVREFCRAAKTGDVNVPHAS